MNDDSLTKEIPVNSVVLQVNVLSAMLFVMIMIFFFMKNVIDESREGTRCVINRKLVDLECNDETELIIIVISEHFDIF